MITSNAFSVKMDEADLAAVLTMCADLKKAAGKVIVRALNKTLAGVKTDASTAIRAVVTASKSTVDATFRVKTVRGEDLSGYFASTGRPLPLSAYSVTQTKKGVSVHLKRVNPRKVIKGTFIATMKSGHVGVFERDYYGHKKGTPISRPVRPNVRYGRLPRKYRLPISELFGLRVPDVLGHEPTMKTILIGADKRLHTNLMHELEYELSLHK